MKLFDAYADQEMEAEAPLAERMRPRSLAEFYGQQHVVGKGGVIRNAIDADRIFSMILWGPPGCGKTTLARMIARETKNHFIHFSAVLSGVKDIRAVVDIAKDQRSLHHRKTILFVDEIHRFNKSQQDAFLHHVENGLITLIGATTENPSFEVISPLLSRCHVIVLESLSAEDLGQIAKFALTNKERGLGELNVSLSPEAMTHLIEKSDGDARNVLNSLDLVCAFYKAKKSDNYLILLEDIEEMLLSRALKYDKSGEEHYNLISALHKSLRGSDPDASLYWLARMLEAGENPLYIARRMVRFASEDIGNADPYALQVAMSAMEAYRFLGSPEGDLALAHAATYLATAPKSNSIYMAYGNAIRAVHQQGALPVPLHIRNAPTKLMKKIGYGEGYQYAHTFEDAFVSQAYLPEQLQTKQFYIPTNRGFESTIRKRLAHWRNKNSPPSQKDE